MTNFKDIYQIILEWFIKNSKLSLDEIEKMVYLF